MLRPIVLRNLLVCLTSDGRCVVSLLLAILFAVSLLLAVLHLAILLAVSLLLIILHLLFAVILISLRLRLIGLRTVLCLLCDRGFSRRRKEYFADLLTRSVGTEDTR